MRAKSYSKYKRSGIEWLGKVPDHWEVKRGRFCMRVNPPSENLRQLGSDDEVSFVPMDAVGEYGGLNLETAKQIGEIGGSYTEFQNGDVVVAKITPCFENGKGALANGLVNGAALGTTELHVLRPLPGLERRFLFYLTISSIYRKTGEAEMYGAGGQKRVPTEFNKDFRIPLPLPPEQYSIADFLDRETAKIDALVKNKRTLIERLKEKRAALISRAVTRGLPPEAARAAGLDPHPKLKPSGVDWLGDVPEHWTIKRMGDELEFVSYGFTNPMPTTNEGPFMVTANDINDGRVLFDTARYTSLEDFEKLTRKSKPQCRDILVTKDGTLGRIAVVDSRIPFCINQSVALLRPKPSANERFIAMALQSPPYFDRMVFEAGGTTIKHIYITRLARMPIAVPPVPEQSAIAARLELETAKIDAMVAKIETAIERLQEYRTALITAAVTGKIDVHGETADNRQELVSAS